MCSSLIRCVAAMLPRATVSATGGSNTGRGARSSRRRARGSAARATSTNSTSLSVMSRRWPSLRLVFAQPASASICERINSEFAFVKDKRRNRLEHGRANKMVALFHNLRLITRAKKPNYTEPAVGWNDEDFNTGVTKFGVANYEGTEKLKVKQLPQRPALMPPSRARGAGTAHVGR